MVGLRSRPLRLGFRLLGLVGVVMVVVMLVGWLCGSASLERGKQINMGTYVRRYGPSSVEKNVIAFPGLPARPVRPILWM